MMLQQAFKNLSHFILYHIPQLTWLVVFLCLFQFWIFGLIWPLFCLLVPFNVYNWDLISRFNDLGLIFPTGVSELRQGSNDYNTGGSLLTGTAQSRHGSNTPPSHCLTIRLGPNVAKGLTNRGKRVKVVIRGALTGGRGGGGEERAT